MTIATTSPAPATPPGADPEATRFWPLLGLSPLLAAADSMLAGVGLGLGSAAVFLLACATAWALRGRVAATEQLPVALLLVVAAVGLVGQIFRAYLFEVHLALVGLLPLVAANGATLGRAQAALSAPRDSPVTAGLRLAAGLALVPAAAGASREWGGAGLVALAGCHLAATPAAGFLLLAALAAARGAWLTRRPRR